MKRLILLLLLLACFPLTAFPATTAPPMTIDNLRSTTIGIGGETNNRVLSGYSWGRGFTMDGTSQFFARTNSTIQYLNFENGSEIVLNNGFESFVGTQDAGNSTFSSWTQVNAGDAVYMATAGAQDATNAVKLSGTLQTGILRQVMTVVPGVTYVLSFWAHGDGTGSPRITFTDLTHGTNFLTAYDTGFSSTTFQYWSDSFVAPAGCTQFQLDLIQPPLPGQYCVFDSVHLRQQWDMSFVMWLNRSDDPTTVIRQYTLTRLQGNTNRIWYMSFAGNDEPPFTGKIRFGQDPDGSNPQATVFSQTVLATGQWYQVVATYQTVGLPGRQSAIGKIYVNGVLENTYSLFQPMYVPMRSSETPLAIAATSVPFNLHLFHGSIGEVEILAGHCLSDLEVSQIYAGGVAAYYPGATTIAHYTWLGDTASAYLRDASLTGNDMTAFGSPTPTPITFTGAGYVERMIDYSYTDFPGRALTAPGNLHIVGNLSLGVQPETQTAPVEFRGPSGPFPASVVDIGDPTTTGLIRMGVDATSSFNAWIQSATTGGSPLDLNLQQTGGVLRAGVPIGGVYPFVMQGNNVISPAFVLNGAAALSAATNSAPADPVNIKFWFGMTNTSNGQVYKIPLYQ